jgi:hypothetical protein
MEYPETEVIASMIRDMANLGRVPVFLRGLPDVPRLLPLYLPVGSARDRRTGAVVTPQGDDSVAFESSEAAERWRTRCRALRADLATLVAKGRLPRTRLKTLAVEAHQVKLITRGDQRGLRPADIDFTGLTTSGLVAYLLRILATAKYGRRLAQCEFEGCENFFLREPRQSRPECYCGPDHRKQAKRGATAARGRDFRARLKAIEQLKARYPVNAEKMVMAVVKRGERGVSTEQLVKRAEAHAAARKHK